MNGAREALLEREWQRYQSRLRLPVDDRLKRSFYAGAYALFGVLEAAPSSPPEAAEVMRGVEREILAYARAVGEGL